MSKTLAEGALLTSILLNESRHTKDIDLCAIDVGSERSTNTFTHIHQHILFSAVTAPSSSPQQYPVMFLGSGGQAPAFDSRLLLIMAGDVEVNPGPKIQKRCCHKYRITNEGDPRCKHCDEGFEDTLEHWLKCAGTAEDRMRTFGYMNVDLSDLTRYPRESISLARKTLFCGGERC